MSQKMCIKATVRKAWHAITQKKITWIPWVRPNERRFVCVKVYLLRDSETMLEVCDDFKSEVTGIGKFTPPWVRLQKNVILNCLDMRICYASSFQIIFFHLQLHPATRDSQYSLDLPTVNVVNLSKKNLQSQKV